MSTPDPAAWAPQRLASAFPVMRNLVYANHAALSPWPRATRDAVEAFARENAERGPLNYVDWLKLETGLRRRLARLLNAADAADIALVRNTSEGVNIVANGLDWSEGDNVVTPEGEYITNQLAWDRLQDAGVEIRRVDIRGDAPERSLLARVDDRTRVVTVSAVQWDDGFRLDLAALGADLRGERPVFFVDAIQQFGAMPVDVRASGIDCLASGAHKWMMGPEGMGVFYCRPGLRDELALHQWGWHMLDDPYRFGRAGRDPSSSARRFEPGSPNTMGQVALDASLAVLESYGQEAVAERVLANSRRLAAGIRTIAGLELLSDDDPSRMSGIVSFIPSSGAAHLYQALKSRGVICAVRGEAIRLSPHFYQHGKQLDELLAAVEGCK